MWPHLFLMDCRSLIKLIIIIFFDGMSFYWKQSQHSGEPHNITLKLWKVSIVEILHSRSRKFRILVVYSWRWCCYRCFRVHVWVSKTCIWTIIIYCTDFTILIQLLQQDVDHHHHCRSKVVYAASARSIVQILQCRFLKLHANSSDDGLFACNSKAWSTIFA